MDAALADQTLTSQPAALHTEPVSKQQTSSIKPAKVPPNGKASMPPLGAKAVSAEKLPRGPASAPAARRRVVLEESDGDGD